jgi:hypothetical protein
VNQAQKGYYQGESQFSGASVTKGQRIQIEYALDSKEAIMVHASIAVAVLLLLPALVFAWFHFNDGRHSAAISTTEWVKLMRENDLKFDRAARARAARPSPSRVR